jgi:hypothetical protein
MSVTSLSWSRNGLNPIAGTVTRARPVYRHRRDVALD